MMPNLAVFFAALGLHAWDLSGIWTGQIPGRNGAMLDIAFQFTQTGSKLSGKLYGDYRGSPLEGIVSGDLVTFVVTSAEQAGNQINTTRLRFTGSVKDGVLELYRERESSTNAGNRGGVQMREGGRVPVRLKRL